MYFPKSKVLSYHCRALKSLFVVSEAFQLRIPLTAELFARVLSFKQRFTCQASVLDWKACSHSRATAL